MTETETCPVCGRGEVHAIAGEHDVTWGGPDSVYAEHGQHTFRIVDARSRCSACGEEFYTYEQSLAHTRALDEAVKAKLGLDLAADRAARRAARGDR